MVYINPPGCKKVNGRVKFLLKWEITDFGSV